MYKICKCIYSKKDGSFIHGWIMESDNNSYPFFVNKFLHQVALSSTQTAKQYAYKLRLFLNYLDAVWNISYIEAEINHLKKFIKYMQYGDILTIGIVEGNKSGFTIQSYINVIKRFYEFLYGQDIVLNLSFKEKYNMNLNSYLYGQNWWTFVTKLEIDDAFDRSKPPIEYEKWYTREQIEAILSNLNTYRDKAIFSISLDGLRIDEILSAKMSGYNDIDGTLTLYHSKGRREGNTNRICVLSQQSLDLLEEYFFNERAEVENDLLEKGKLPADEVFINIRKRDDSYGNAIQYHNVWEIIKRAAKRAGLDPKKIRTHSGRSTKAGELFRYQAENPEKLSDTKIKEIMGWKNISSAEPYKNRQDKESTLITAKKLNEIKMGRGNLNERN